MKIVKWHRRDGKTVTVFKIIGLQENYKPWIDVMVEKVYG